MKHDNSNLYNMIPYMALLSNALGITIVFATFSVKCRYLDEGRMNR